jgi:hypothetical protein
MTEVKGHLSFWKVWEDDLTVFGILKIGNDVYELAGVRRPLKTIELIEFTGRETTEQMDMFDERSGDGAS